MRTRFSGAAKPSARAHRVCAFLLVLAAIGGCAQIVGIEEWHPVECGDEPNLDPETCQPTSGCSECLSSRPQACEAERKQCQGEQGTCPTVYLCSTQCDPEVDPLTCVQGCCAEHGSSATFKAYLTCLCDACQKECSQEAASCMSSCT
jgi:hypothetical protein